MINKPQVMFLNCLFTGWALALIILVVLNLLNKNLIRKKAPRAPAKLKAIEPKNIANLL